MKSNETSYLTFSDQYSESRRAFSYFMPDLLGGKIHFQYDAREMGCDCIGQVSLLAMPAIDNLG
jgi:hypothetical protein